MTLFAQALPPVRLHEGGKVNHPRDPGGRTNQGVIQRTYDAYRKRRRLPLRTVYDMTDAERDDIYRSQYWDVIRGDDLPVGVGYVVFDGAVNSGPSQSVKWLQRALGVVADGVVGEHTLEAARNHTNPRGLIDAILNRRLTFLKALKTWPTFGKGWSRRISGVRTLGKSMSVGVPLPDVEPPDDGHQKAPVTDAKEIPGRGIADAITGGGVVAGGGAATLDEARDSLAPVAADGGWIGTIFTIIILAGIVLTFAGIAWRVYSRHQERKLKDALDL